MPSGSTPLVLIADANEDRRLNLTHLLEQDFQVIEARRGDESLVKYQEHQPRVILIDAVSPDVDGYRLCRQIRQLSHTQSIFVLMMVPNEAGAIEQAFKAGATDCLIPPIHNDSLRYRLQQWLATHKLVAQQNGKRLAELSKFEHAPDGMYRITLEGQFLEVNTALVQMLGYDSADEILQLRMAQDVFIEAISITDFEQSKQSYDVIKGIDRVLQRKDDEHLIVTLRNRIVRNEQGDVAYIEGLVQDVTARRRTEQMLQSIVKGTATKIGDDFFQSVLQYLVAVANVKYAYIGECDDEQINIMAYWSGGFVEDSLTFSLAGTPAESVLEHGRALYPLRTWELFPNDPSLRERNIEAYMGTALYDGQGKLLGLIAILHDEVIENLNDAEAVLAIFAARVGAELARKQSEMVLREREQRFRTVIETAYDFVILTNHVGETVYVSSALTQILGYTPDELLGEARFELIHPNDRDHIAQAFSDLIQAANGARTSLQYQVQHKDGSWRWLDAKSINLLDEVGLNAVITSFHDITESKHTELALRESEARFRHISDISSDYAFALRVLPDKILALEWITDVFGQITGISAATPITYTEWLSVIHPDDRIELNQHLQTLLNVAISIEAEYRLQAKDGGIRYIWGQMRSIKDETETHVERIYGTARDITEQKLAQIAEQEQRRLAEALLATASNLSSTLDLEVIMQQVLEHVGLVVPHDAANIMLAEASGARVVHGRGYPPEFETTMGQSIMSLDTPSLAAMIETGQPYVVDDTTTDPNWIPSQSNWTRSYLGAPIQTAHKFIGFLNLNSRTPQFFTEDHGRRLQAFADQMAIAMANAWLFEQAQSEIEERKAAEKTVQQRETVLTAVSFVAEQLLKASDWRDVMGAILEALGQASNVSRVYLFENFVDPDGVRRSRYAYEWTAAGIDAYIGDTHLQAHSMDDDGLGRWEKLLENFQLVYGHLREMPERENPIMLEQNIASIALVPVFVNNKWWGFMGFDACVVERQWMTAELDALQTAANILGSVIERQAVEAQIERRNQELEALRSIALAVGGTLQLEAVLRLLLTHLKELVPYRSASIALVEDNQLRFVAWEDFPENTDFSRLEGKLHRKMMDRLNQMGHQFLNIGDTQAENDWVAAPGLLEYIRNWLGVALVYRGKIIGILNLDHSTPNFFTEEHATVAMAVAQQAAIAIENARLYGELESQVIERTTELSVQRGQTELILQSVADGIILMNTDGKIQYVNAAWEQLTGYTNNEVIGRDPLFVTADDSGGWSFEVVRQQVMNGEKWRGVVPVVHKDGEKYELEMILAPIVDDGGEISQLVGVQRDVTEARHLEAMKTQFIADAAHDLGNPVATLQIRLFLIDADRAHLDEHLSVIRHQVERLEALSNNLLMLSRLDRGVLPMTHEQLDLNSLIMHIVIDQQALALRKNITLTFNPNKGLTTVIGSRDQLERMVVNLIQNAINYTPDNGKIEISTNFDDQWVKISVKDTGIGILPSNVERIFDRFFRSDRVRTVTEGTGLGLSIVKEIVDLHRGKIELESEVDKGSIFTILLPISS